MAEPPGEWLATPDSRAEPNSEWTAEPLPPKAHARYRSAWKSVSTVIGGVLTVVGLVIFVVYLVGDFANHEANDSPHAAVVPVVTPSHKSPGPPSAPTTTPAPSIPAKPREATEANTHWISAPSSGLPQVDLTLASGPLPSTLKLGNPITLDLEATCLATGDEESGARDGRTRGGISVSVDGDATLSSPSANADHYPIGAPITVYDQGSVWFSNQRAKDELIEKTASPWRKGKMLSLKVVVTPTRPGDVTLFVRSTATLRKRPVSSTENFSEFDQQRLPVKAFRLTISE